VYVRWRN